MTKPAPIWGPSFSRFSRVAVSNTFLFCLPSFRLFLARHFYGRHTHDGQQLQRKGEAELALIDSVDEHLEVYGHTVSFQSARKLLVRKVLTLTKVLDNGFGACLVELARFHSKQMYMVFKVPASYPDALCFSLDK